MIRADAKNFVTRLPGLFRGDYTAIMLVIANIYPVIDMLLRGDPIGSILIIYWIQMMIIGFWTIFKLVAIARWAALAFVPMFLVMYLSITNMFAFVAGGLLDDQMQGTAWHQNFSPWDYLVPGLLFFITHGLSFAVNFIGHEEYKHVTAESQIGKPFMRAMPMWMAALVGGFIGSFFQSAAIAVVFVLPVKLALDVLGHFVDHGKLRLDEDPDVPLIS